jgi:hypothetical protein
MQEGRGSRLSQPEPASAAHASRCTESALAAGPQTGGTLVVDPGKHLGRSPSTASLAEGGSSPEVKITRASRSRSSRILGSDMHGDKKTVFGGGNLMSESGLSERTCLPNFCHIQLLTDARRNERGSTVLPIARTLRSANGRPVLPRSAEAWALFSEHRVYLPWVVYTLSAFLC